MKNKLFAYILAAIVIVLLSSIAVIPAIQQISGLAVAQSKTKWNNVQDAAVGDNQTSGVMVMNPYWYDGTNFDRSRGDSTNGLDVDVTRVTGTVTIAPPTAGNAFYAIKRVNIAAVSVNLPFGFTSEKLIIETPGSNTDEVCIDWLGGTAVCPAANTAGDDRLASGRSVIFDNYAQTSISVIAASGTQTIYVRAFD